MEFEYFKVSEATGLELEYLWAGIGVYQGISSHGPGITSYGDGIRVCQGISGYGGGIFVSEATGMELEYFKVSQAMGLELEYLKGLKVSQATGLVSQSGWNLHTKRVPRK